MVGGFEKCPECEAEMALVRDCNAPNCPVLQASGEWPEGLPKGGQINPMIDQCGNACAFYMFLHLDKGGWMDEPAEHFLEGIFRNLHDFYKAYRTGDEREMLAEGCGVANNVFMFLSKFCPDELAKVQDWPPLLDRIKQEAKGGKE